MKTKVIAFLLILAIAAPLALHAYAHNLYFTRWNKTYGGDWPDVAHSAQQTNDNGCVIAGQTSSFGAGGIDFYLAKTDSNGNMQWNRTYGGTNQDEAYAVRQTIDGGYIIAGTTYSFDATWDPDFWLIKLTERKLAADINGDGTINVLDISAVAKSFGSRPGDQSWNLDSDVDGNGIINTIDVTLVAKDFDKSA